LVAVVAVVAVVILQLLMLQPIPVSVAIKAVITALLHFN
jgi:hypothetical protein